MRKASVFVRLAAPLAIFAAACGPAPSASCVEGLDTATCKPLYDPTFDNVYSHTLAKTCALSGSSCHAPEGGMGGLALDSADSAYEQLTSGKSPRVIGGDAPCSLLVERIESEDEGTQMPPGSPLSDPERCAIEQWIQNGAKR